MKHGLVHMRLGKPNEKDIFDNIFMPLLQCFTFSSLPPASFHIWPHDFFGGWWKDTQKFSGWSF